jgi:hypothetical protein
MRLLQGSSGRTKQYYKDVSSYHANGTDVNMEFIQKGIIKVFRIMGLTPYLKI